ncbi:uncharacterized protein LOC130655824 [Hydractinia symbiolongicarpus]|uniref:uncharacterized protein LOC130655824 n=1 Tax=Hydractinia symbiolongicarpus TaxID=13093 RepID=UPI00254CB0F0|nr:uncharacterized protein LOC130655824 [Hydractinia symbiolongicarpus]
MAQKIRQEIRIAAGVIAGLQLFFGLSMCICCFIFAGKTSDAFAPFWTAIPLLFSACFGIACAITRNQCLLTAWLVIDIILTIMLFIGAALTSIASALFSLAVKYLEKYGCYDIGNNCVCRKSFGHTQTFHDMSCDNIKMVHSLLEALTAFGVLGGLSALAATIFACAGLCCYKPKENNVVLAQGGQTVIISSAPPVQNNHPQGIITYQPPVHHQPPPPSYYDNCQPQDTKPVFIH